MGTISIYTDSIAYRSGHYRMEIIALQTPLTKTINMKLLSCPKFKYGYVSDNPFLLFPDNVTAAISGYSLNDFIEALDSLLNYETIVKIWRDDNNTTPYFQGAVTQKSINQTHSLRLIEFTIYNALIDWKTPLVKRSSEFIYWKLSDYILGQGSYNGFLLSSYQLTSRVDYRVNDNRTATPEQMSIWDCYFNEELFWHTRTPYKTMADMNKAILANLSATIICAPFRKGYLVPFLYDGDTDLFQPPVEKIIDLSIEPADIDTLNLKVRKANDAFDATGHTGPNESLYIDYSSENYQEGFIWAKKVRVWSFTIMPKPYYSRYTYNGITLLVIAIDKKSRRLENGNTLYWYEMTLRPIEDTVDLTGLGTLTAVAGYGDVSVSFDEVQDVTINNSGNQCNIPFPLSPFFDKYDAPSPEGWLIPNKKYCTDLYYAPNDALALCEYGSVLSKDIQGDWNDFRGSSFEQILITTYHFAFENLKNRIRVYLSGTGYPNYKFFRFPICSEFLKYQLVKYRICEYSEDVENDKTEIVIQPAIY